jgi:Predicted NTP pyrophosphohydrolase
VGRGDDSAGILLWRRTLAGPEVLLVHPGGPYWRNKDDGAWTIPKGQLDPGEEPLDAAVRELKEETGVVVDGPFVALGTVRQKAGKRVSAFACEGDCDADAIVSNSFEMEWPPRSGKVASFPEVDRAEWFEMGEARAKIIAGQAGFLDELESLIQSTKPLS